MAEMTVKEAAEALIAENRILIAELQDQISYAEVRIRTQRYAGMLESKRLEDEGQLKVGDPWLRDDTVEMVWKCCRCNGLEAVSPSFIAGSGIPVCSCADDSDDMRYMGIRTKRTSLVNVDIQWDDQE